jgi:hypothetical protein
MGPSENKKGNGRLRTGGPLVASLTCLLSLVLFYSSPALADGIRSELTFSKQQMHLAGVNPAEVQNALFVKFKEMHPSQIAESDSTTLSLGQVSFFGRERPGIWLRSVCTGAKSHLILQECRGSACKPMAANLDNQNSKKLLFTGEYGQYFIHGHGLQAVLGGKKPASTEQCNMRWPAWAVSARSFSKESTLALPRDLLFIQTQKELIWIDALSKKLWNRSPWDIGRSGVFNAIEANEHGQLLLTSSSAALWLDFSTNTSIFVQNNNIQIPDFGLSSLFAADEWSQGMFPVILPQGVPSERVATNLGGLFWKKTYLTWSQVISFITVRRTPESIYYQPDAGLSSAQWSDSSGQGKTRLVFRGKDQLRVLSLEDGQNKFVEIKKLNFEESSISSEARVIFAEDQFSTFSKDGLFNTIEGKFHRLLHSAGNTGQLIQLGSDVFITSPSKPGACRIHLLRAQSESAGWEKTLSSESSNCTLGIGRSSHSATLTEINDGGLKIRVLSH